MKYAVVFLAFAAACVFAATQTASLALQIGALWCAFAFGGVGLAYAFVGPRAFGKRPDGTLPAWSRIVYAPYFALNALSLWGFRRSAKRSAKRSARENDFDEIAPNIFLGCRLNRSDRATIERLQIRSVFDVTSEFGETKFLRDLNYQVCPLLDTQAPTLDQLRAGAQWITAATSQGPVYVHCALGHGRSATFVAAALVSSGQAENAHSAIETIRRQRPHIGLSRAQLAVMQQLDATRAARALSN